MSSCRGIYCLDKAQGPAGFGRVRPVGDPAVFKVVYTDDTWRDVALAQTVWQLHKKTQILL